MKTTRSQLRNLIRESLGDDEVGIDKASLENLQGLIRTLDSDNIKQAAALCDALGIDFKQTATYVVKSLIDSKWKIADQIESDVVEHIQKIVKNNLGFYLHNDKSNIFYLEDENKASNLSMEFYYGVTGSIINYIERYLIDMVVAIGNE